MADAAFGRGVYKKPVQAMVIFRRTVPGRVYQPGIVY